MNTRSDTRRASAGMLVIGLGAVALLVVATGLLPRLLGGGETVHARFATTKSLHKGEPVRIDGVTVGKVTGVAVDRDSGTAVVEMHLDDDAGPLYRNARAAIKWRTLLGASYAVAIDRGTPGLPRLGSATIPASRTSAQVELDEVTAALRERSRRGMQQTFQELPQALGADAPGAFAREVAEQGPAIAAGFDALRGQQPNRDLGRLVTQTGAAMNALDAPRDGLRRLVEGAAVTLHTTAARSGDIQDTLDVANDAMPRVRRTLAELDGTLSNAIPLLHRLEDPAGQVAPALTRLTPAAQAGSRLLNGPAEPLLRSLRPTATALAGAAHRGVPLLDALQPSLDRIDKDILPQLATRSPESKRRTYEMIGPVVAGLDGVGSHYDAHSTFIRFTGNGGARIVDDLPCRAFFADAGASAYLQCQAAGRLLKRLFGAPPRGRRAGHR